MKHAFHIATLQPGQKVYNDRDHPISYVRRRDVIKALEQIQERLDAACSTDVLSSEVGDMIRTLKKA